jgi:hypothetical protein
LENLEEMDKFLESYKHPKLNREDIKHISTSLTLNEIEAEIVSLKKKNVRPDRFLAEFYQTSKEEY